MAKISLKELLDELSRAGKQAGAIGDEWNPQRAKGIAEAFGEMLASAGLSSVEVDDLRGSLQSSLLNIGEDASAIPRETGSAHHVIEKGRRLIRAKATGTDGFRLD
jgi:hypothetical protein